ncbi:MAG: hypothetical protein E7623_05390 [Ruminococcaceae bacterium]|nr:hypothetical protein [Oscillospiraceae bacterium]
MTHSLLYKKTEKTEFDGECMSSLIYDLSLDRAVSEMCDSKLKADYFLNVLKKPLTDAENISYRVELLKDFENNPKLLSELRILLNHYDNIINDWQDMRPSGNYSGMRGNYAAMTEYTFGSLHVALTFTKTTVSYIRFIAETLSGYKFESEALKEIEKRCNEIIESDGLTEINEVIDLFSAPSADDYSFDVNVGTDDTFRLSDCKVSKVAVLDKKKKNVLGKLFSKKDKSFQRIELGNAYEDDALYAVNKGIMDLYDTLNSVALELYNEFYGMSKELLFYETACEIKKHLKDLGMGMCIPHILECTEDRFDAKGLKDMFLVCEIDDASLIADNDTELSERQTGMLIKGSNSSGKTSFIRAVGIAQLFAQAGLFVCASKADISIRHGIFSHFSSAEKEFKEGDSAGRFEGEVQEIANIVQNLKPHSILLLNETFQTTVYDEGTEGIHGILKYMPRFKTQFLFVTRLTKLFDMMSSDNVGMLETDDTYKVRTLETGR